MLPAMSEIDSRWRLDDQTALVTGASRGIGLACVRELASRGGSVLMVARDESALDAAFDEVADQYPDAGLWTFAADLTEAEERLAVFDWISDLGEPLSLLVNNVGGNSIRATLDYEEDEVRSLLELNLISAFAMCRLAHPQLRQHAKAAIVNVGSVAARTHVGTGAPYAMSKAGLEQLTRNLACEWAEDGIRVNAVSPWYIRTQRSETALVDPDYLDDVLSRTPMDRIGEPEEVAAAVTFLCLPAASYITGEILAVDGGFLKLGF